jgi:hypothetical protein
VRDAQYIIRVMRAGASIAAALVVCLLTACTNPLARQYEYAEQLYLDVDGSAELVIDSSIAALVALRGLPLDPSPSVPVDRAKVRQLFSDAGCGEVTVNRPWTRHGRRFVQIVLEQDDVAQFVSCGPVSWSTYEFRRVAGDQREEIHFTRVLGPPTPGDPGDVNWTGREIVGFKLHLPSRILFHNVRRLEDGAPGDPERGNILAWEQWLRDRREGQPIRMEVRLASESILHRALLLFAMAFTAAVMVILSAVWIVVRRARRKQKLRAGS